MAKLRDLITEREFGEPLPTFKGVMKQHQVNKLKEDWWDDMDAKSQADYIKKHPGSKQAQQADDGGDEEPSDDEPKGEPSAWSQKAQKAKDDLEGLNKWGAAPDEIGDWIEDNKWSLSGGKLGKAANLEFAPVQKAYDELEDAYIAAEEEDDWDAYDKAKEDFSQLANQKLDSQMVSRRTGKELDQETITIDGKQFRRMSEGVEKQPKPKYEFSEFYKRFKR